MGDHEAYKQRTKGVPVVNKDTGRTVYVNPETLKTRSKDFDQIGDPDKAGDPRWRGKSKPPRRPARPHKPEVPRDPPPTRIRPSIPKKRVRPTNEVKPVKEVPDAKHPEPSPKRKWKKLKRLNHASAEAIVTRYLLALAD